MKNKISQIVINNITSNLESGMIKIHLTEALKISFGSALAVVICTLFNLPHPYSAGTITLLTLMGSTRKQTMSLIAKRYVSFGFATFLCWLIFPHVKEVYTAYGLYLFCIVSILWTIGWKDTLSVNAVIGTAFLLDQTFSLQHILIELAILTIGIGIAFVLNLYQPDHAIANLVYEQIFKVEYEIMHALKELSGVLKGTNKIEASAKTLQQILDDMKKAVELIQQYYQNRITSRHRWILNYLELGFAQYSLIHVLTTQLDLQPIDKNGIDGVIDHIEQSTLTVIDIIEPMEWLKKNRSIIQQVESNAHHVLDDKSQGILLIILYNLGEFVQLKQNFLNRLSKQEKEEFIDRHHYMSGKYANKLIGLQDNYEQNKH